MLGTQILGIYNKNTVHVRGHVLDPIKSVFTRKLKRSHQTCDVIN